MSEIARLREKVDLECRASRAALKGIAAGVAQHRFIEARLRNIDYYHSRLSTLVGEEQATAYLCEVFEPKEGEE